jgi:hypothetical protein
MAAHHDSHHQSSAPYETTDANVHQISIWTVSIFVTMFAGMISMAALLFGFVKFPASLERPPTAAEYERSLPPAPRLQVNQVDDLRQFREREQQMLTTYGREPNSGAIRIPIDKAIDIVSERGVLPKTAAAVAPAATAAAPVKK